MPKQWLLRAYQHLGFGNATTPIIVINKLFNHFFPEKAKPIIRRKPKGDTETEVDDAIDFIATAISGLNESIDNFLQTTIRPCPHKTDAGNANGATKNT